MTYMPCCGSLKSKVEILTSKEIYKRNPLSYGYILSVYTYKFDIAR